MKLEKMKSMSEQESSSMLENLTREGQEKIGELKRMHLEDLKAQAIGQKAAFATFKASLENSKSHEMELLRQAHQSQVEVARQEAEQAFFVELDNVKQVQCKKESSLGFKKFEFPNICGSGPDICTQRYSKV